MDTERREGEVIGHATITRGRTPTWPARWARYWDCSKFGFGRVRINGGPGGVMLNDNLMLDLQSGAITVRHIKRG